ncbi:MAG: hypothetical protein AB7U20_01620 [Planctomycetaceae bacterium]
MIGTASWNRTLTDRQRVLLHTQPLMLMRYHWLSRDDDGQRYDPLCLWIKLFEVVIDQSGFGNDVVRESVARELMPLLRAVDASNHVAPEEIRYRRVVDRLIGHLLNESNRGESFSIDYTDFDTDGQSDQLTLTFKLLKEVHGYTGEIALELSSEAINLFLNALDLDIESEQIANEAVVQFQLERGNFDKARSSAEVARARSLQYEQKLGRFIEQAKRDIRRVDWREEVHTALVEANEHVDLRLRIEEDIIRTARTRLDAISEDDSVVPLTEVIRLMQDCRSRHLRLNRRLMTARDEFIEQQSRQCFVETSVSLPVNLRDDVLGTLLELPTRVAVQFLSDTGHALVGPTAPGILNLCELVHWQLQPKREAAIGETDLEDVDLVEASVELSRFDDETFLQCEKVIQELSMPVRLSELLNHLAEDGCPESVQDAVTLQILERFDPDDDGLLLDVQVNLAERASLNCARCCGDDLQIEIADHFPPPVEVSDQSLEVSHARE